MSLLYEKKLRFGTFKVFSSVPPLNYVTLKQVHGVTIVPAEAATSETEADGLFTASCPPKKDLAILTADCLPIILQGEGGTVFLHAGWRGIAGQIYYQKEAVAIAPEYAFIGPHIKACCFEVQPDFKANFPGSTFFEERDGKLFFDMEKQVTHDLKLKFPGIILESSPVCTRCNDSYHSYRRDGTSKRNWNIFCA